MEMAFTADGHYAYATSFYDGRVQALKRNATHGQARRRSTRRSRSTSRTASPSRPTARTSTPPTGAGRRHVQPRPGNGRDHQGRPTPTAASSTRARPLRDGDRHQPRRQVRLRGASARSTRSSIFARDTQTGVLTRVPGPAGLRERARPPGRRRPATAGACVAAPAMLRDHRPHGRPGRHARLHRVRPGRLDRRPHARRDHGPAHAGGRRRAVRRARRQAGTGRTTTTRSSTRRLRLQGGQPALGVPERHLVLARRRAAPTSPAGRAWPATRATPRPAR